MVAVLCFIVAQLSNRSSGECWKAWLGARVTVKVWLPTIYTVVRSTAHALFCTCDSNVFGDWDLCEVYFASYEPSAGRCIVW